MSCQLRRGIPLEGVRSVRCARVYTQGRTSRTKRASPYSYYSLLSERAGFQSGHDRGSVNTISSSVNKYAGLCLDVNQIICGNCESVMCLLD